MIRSACAAVFCFALVACGPSTVQHGDDDQGTPDAAVGVPACTVGATQACYSGAAGTSGVGPCKGGTQTCGSDGTWGACSGEVAPKGEVCGNSVDDNCNGAVDEDND